MIGFVCYDFFFVTRIDVSGLMVWLCVCVWTLMLCHINCDSSCGSHYGDLKRGSWRLKSPTNQLFVQRFVQAVIKETWNLHFDGPVPENKPVTDRLFSQRASDVESSSISPCHHGSIPCTTGWCVYNNFLMTRVVPYKKPTELGHVNCCACVGFHLYSFSGNTVIFV